MTSLLACIWRLFRLCLTGRGGKLGLLCILCVLGLNLAGIYLAVRMISWYNDFYNALQKMNSEAALRQFGVFILLIALMSGQALLAAWVRKMGQMKWREALTRSLLDSWLGNQAHWRLSQCPRRAQVDNPDQRIAEDCEIFVRRLSLEAIDVITMVVGLVTYISVLWSLATFALPLNFIGLDVDIPRYMVWCAPIYVLLSSVATHLLGARLMHLNMEQQHREADFRYALGRLREASGAVGLLGGEIAERRILDERFGRIVVNWRSLIRREFIVGCFVRPYMMSTMRLPLFLAAPAYFAGNVALGGLMQLNVAFQQVTQTMSWFIFSYNDLAEFVSAARRLDDFRMHLQEAHAEPGTVECVCESSDLLAAQDLVLTSPHGQVILRAPDFSVRAGETVWLRGCSGRGKSTLFKALARLWQYGQGRITLPSGTALFLPQHPYLPLGDLRTAAVYPARLLAPGDTRPNNELAFTHAEADILLTRVGLANRGDQVIAGARTATTADNHPVAHGLSGGELQRLMLARVIAARPDWVFLDEATSALDADSEREMFALLRNALPNSALIIIAHNRPRVDGLVREIDLAHPETPPTSMAQQCAEPSLPGRFSPPDRLVAIDNLKA